MKLFECTKCRHRSAAPPPPSSSGAPNPPRPRPRRIRHRVATPPSAPTNPLPSPPPTRFSQAIDLETNDIPPLPEECPSAQGCPGTKFNPISEGADALLWDYQEIRVQEHMLRLEFGASPCSVTVLLQARKGGRRSMWVAGVSSDCCLTSFPLTGASHEKTG